MGLPYDALSVAYYFLGLGKRDRVKITPMKLQKLIYFAHGWCLAIRKEALICESVEAWQYGPVIISVYYEFCKYGSNPIPTDIYDILDNPISSDPFTSRLLEKVWTIYKDFTAFELSQMTHLPDAPWITAREGDARKKSNVIISDDLIQSYFIEQAKQPN